MDAGYEVLAVAAAHHFKLIWTEGWPMVAAYLIVAGFDGPKVVELASLSVTVNAWIVDPLVAVALEEIQAPELGQVEGASVVARLFGMSTADDDALLRRLARLAPATEYEVQVFVDAYFALEEVEQHRSSTRRDSFGF